MNYFDRPFRIATPPEIRYVTPAPGSAFSDYFAGLNSNVWTVLSGSGGVGTVMNFTPANVVTGSDGLRIIAKQEQSGGFNYTSGIMKSIPSWKYGSFELEAKLPYGQGFWPGIWLYQYPTIPTGFEIDILEQLGQWRTSINVNRHYYVGSNHFQDGKQVGNADFTIAFHKFRIDWTPAAVVWFIDNAEVFRVTTHVPDVPMNLWIDLQVGGTWPGPPDGSTPFPSELDIHYVKYWSY